MLVKLLAMTASTSDGEALTAIRKANGILERNKIHWTELFDKEDSDSFSTIFGDAPFRPARPARRSSRPSTIHTSEEIEEAFEIALANASASFKAFLLSLQEQWNNKHYLTPKQEESLMNAKRNAEGWNKKRA